MSVMERALPRPLDWRLYGLVALATVNAILLLVTLAGFIFADIGGDWYPYWVEAGRRVFDGGLYTWGAEYEGGSYRFSPLLAYAFAALTPIGFWGWTALHFAALAALPRKLALLALVSFPFWWDIYNGGVMTFVVVAGASALLGSRVGTIAFFSLTLLIPRPLMLPVMAWLLWKRPETRIPFLAVAAVQAVLVLMTGWGPEWIATVLHDGSAEVGGPNDRGPALLIGALWIPVGLALAAWLTYRGRLGLASLAASPYWLPYYLLVLLWELRPELPSPGRPASRS